MNLGAELGQHILQNTLFKILKIQWGLNPFNPLSSGYASGRLYFCHGENDQTCNLPFNRSTIIVVVDAKMH